MLRPGRGCNQEPRDGLRPVTASDATLFEPDTDVDSVCTPLLGDDCWNCWVGEVYACCAVGRSPACSAVPSWSSSSWCGYCRSKSATLWWIRPGSQAVMNSRSSGNQMIARPARRRLSVARRELRAQLRGHRFSRRFKSSLDWNWSHKKSPWKFSLSIMSRNQWKIKRCQTDFFLWRD